MTESGKTILVADDDEQINQLIVDALSLRGLRAVSVFNGLDVVPAALREKPDLIILDIQMPGKSGYDVCRDLKEDARLAAIPILIFTVKDRQDDRLTGLKLGAIDYIPKPFYIESLLNKIEYILSNA
jgi:two-component system OmpR family response regulator